MNRKAAAAVTSKPLRLPAYGRELVEAQKTGRNVPWLLIALDWSIGRAMPRVVAVREIPSAALELNFVRGLDCMVAHCGETRRALDIAELALRNGARICPIHDMETGSGMATAEVVAVRSMMAAA